MNIFKIFIVTVVSISTLSAFTFDKWKSGDTFKNVLYIAQSNDVPLAKDGLIHSEKHFRWHLLKNKKQYRTFYYYDNIFGERAKVLLTFTSKSNELYKITIKWNLIGKGTEEFKETLFTILDKKYNKGKMQINTNLGQNIFFKFREWNYNNKTIINARTSRHNIDLTYLDTVSQKTDTETKKKHKLNMIIKDAGKF